MGSFKFEQNYDKICEVMDKICLDTLTLMEEEIQLKLNLENTMTEGENNLAKSRYIMGNSSVSSLQIPENEFESIAKVEFKKDDEKELELSLHDPKKESIQDPIKWFGVLVPQTLHKAQGMYKSSLNWIIEAVNVQNKISQLHENYDKLKQIKYNIKESN